MSIYADDVMTRVNDVLEREGKIRALQSEIIDACGVWKNVDYRPNLVSDTDEDWDRWAQETWDLKDDKGWNERQWLIDCRTCG